MAKRVAGIEVEVEKLEAKLAQIEAHLAAPSGADDVVTLSLEYGRVRDELAARMEEWESATLEAESLGAGV